MSKSTERTVASRPIRRSVIKGTAALAGMGAPGDRGFAATVTRLTVMGRDVNVLLALSAGADGSS